MQPVEAKILLKGLCDSAEGEITDVVTVAGTWGWPGKVDACVTEDNAPF